MPEDQTFNVLLFAVLREAAKADHVEVGVQSAAPVTVGTLLSSIEAQCPAVARWLPHIRVAVNCTYVSSEQVVTPQDEIALIPPVAGGESLPT